MSIPTFPEPAQLIVSVLTPDKAAADESQSVLIERLGPVEQEIGPLDFRYTSYYDAEMGPGIARWLWSFERMLDRAELVHIKCLTNQLELSSAVAGKRRFNLDPGLLTLGNFVLATGKNNAHRIYLGRGIFGDLTLVFRARTYQPLEWTYPDYADPELIKILNRLRESYKCKLTATSRA
ncbi:MAG TPA: DUF4416 family protein [Desulfomonilaceae bacterium]|nr:DUF4416 family protein [Desulfomonilaceae bacterium]